MRLRTICSVAAISAFLANPVFARQDAQLSADAVVSRAVAACLTGSVQIEAVVAAAEAEGFPKFISVTRDEKTYWLSRLPAEGVDLPAAGIMLSTGGPASAAGLTCRVGANDFAATALKTKVATLCARASSDEFIGCYLVQGDAGLRVLPPAEASLEGNIRGLQTGERLVFITEDEELKPTTAFAIRTFEPRR